MNLMVGTKLGALNAFIRNKHLPNVYWNLRPTVEQTNDDDWWSDTFIHSAVNSEEWCFADEWFQRDDQPLYNDTTWDAFWVVELINKIDKWYDDIYGEKWAYATPLTMEAILNMYAYLFVMEKGVEHWKEQTDQFNEYCAEQEEGEEMSVVSDEEPKEVEVYNGSKDFPPNETDETCPICLEAYGEDNPADSIRDSTYESNCPHWCCMPCWTKMLEQDQDEYCCPICKRDISNWLEENYRDLVGKAITKLIIEEDE